MPQLDLYIINELFTGIILLLVFTNMINTNNLLINLNLLQRLRVLKLFSMKKFSLILNDSVSNILKNVCKFLVSWSKVLFLKILNNYCTFNSSYFYEISVLKRGLITFNFMRHNLVGALTDQSYAFSSRIWELDWISNIDIYDSLGSNISLYIYGSEIKRVLAYQNDIINEEWLSNRSRYFFNGLKKWRINIPLIKKKLIMVFVGWIESFIYLFIKIWFFSYFYKLSNLVFINTLFVDSELIITSKLLIKKLGFLSYNKNMTININDYYLYYLNPNFFKNLSDKEIFMFIGYNLRLESPILNIKLRKKKLKNEILYLIVGANFNDNLKATSLGLNISRVLNFVYGKLKICYNVLKKIKKINKKYNNILDLNLIFLGNNVINRLDSKSIFKLFEKFNNKLIINTNNYNGIKNFLSSFFFNVYNKNLKLLKNLLICNKFLHIIYIHLTYLLYEEFNYYQNINNIKLLSKNDIFYLFGIDFVRIKKNIFSIFQGHHLNSEYLNINLIFPSVTFLEKTSNFLNLEGDLLHTNVVLYPPKFCRNDWAILNALYIFLLNFVNEIYQFKIKQDINYLKVNRFFTLIPDFKGFYHFLKKNSINFYFKVITRVSNYIYNFSILKNITCNYIYKLYNTILRNFVYKEVELLIYFAWIVFNGNLNIINNIDVSEMEKKIYTNIKENK